MKETLFELLEKLMPKKHFICTHTFVSEKEKKQYFENCKNVPSKDWFASVQNEHAECIQHWMGSADFWFCHWVADNEDAILDLLNDDGSSELFITLPAEMNYFASKDNDVEDIYGFHSYAE